MGVLAHIVSDGWSTSIVANELRQLYKYHAGQFGIMPEIPRTSFPEFVMWQNRACASSYFDNDIRYWRDQWSLFAGARIAFEDVPFASAPPAKRDFTFRT